MKKFTLTQTLLVAALTLIIGLFIGLLIDYPKTDTDELAGTIGKASKYYNVQVTEDDILLRNELLEDTALRSQYDRYLTYYYYHAIKTTSDISTVLKNTAGVEEFKDYIPVLNKISTYLKTARIDIYGALQIIRIIDSVQNIPIQVFLNDANNSIARMGNQTNALMYYLDAISSFLEKNPTLATAELRDAHDILAINLMTYASVINDKPTLRYLDKRKLANDKERVNQLIADEQFQSEMATRYINPDTERLSGYYVDQAVLRDLLGIDFPFIVDQIVVGSTTLFDTSTIRNDETLRLQYTDQSPLPSILIGDGQVIGTAMLEQFI